MKGIAYLHTVSSIIYNYPECIVGMPNYYILCFNIPIINGYCATVIILVNEVMSSSFILNGTWKLSSLFLVDSPHSSRIVPEDTKALLFRSSLHAISIKFSLRQKFTPSPIEVFGHNQEQNTLLQYLNLSVYSCLVNSKAIQVVTERAKMLPIKILYDFLFAIHISKQQFMISEARYNEHRRAKASIDDLKKKQKQMSIMKIVSDLEIV